MKRLLSAMIATLVFASGSSYAHPEYGRGHHHGHPGRGDWVAPLVLGGVIGYAITQANRPVIVQPTPTVIYPNNLPPVPVGYHYEQLLDANCNCYRWVLVSNY